MLAVLLMYMYFFIFFYFRYLGNKLNNDTLLWWKDANKHFIITFGFLRTKVSLIVVFVLFNEKYLIGKRVPEQNPREMTSQNCNLIGYSTHVASNFGMRGIKKSQKSYVHYFHKDFPQFNNYYS